MASVEFTIQNQKYVVRGEEDEKHMQEVAELVRRRVESIRKKNDKLTAHKAVLLSAFDFANQLLKGRKLALSHQNKILNQALSLRKKLETELAGST